MYSAEIKSLVLKQRLEKISLPQIASNLNIPLSTVIFLVYGEKKGPSMNDFSNEKQLEQNAPCNLASLGASQRGHFVQKKVKSFESTKEVYLNPK
jgi:hypothetical protein